MPFTDTEAANLLRIGLAVREGGKKGGSVTGGRKAAASRRNGRKRKRTPSATKALARKARGK
jgi:hypothetical protein